MSKWWLKTYLRYVYKVFLPKGWTKWAEDKRKNPEIIPGTTWVTLLLGFVFQVQSLEVEGKSTGFNPYSMSQKGNCWDNAV